MLIVIAACEIAFWVFIGLGLGARYLLRRRRTGMVLLATAPLVDVVLLVVTAIHLRGGAVATWQHALAALYIGFSLAFGHQLVAWADVRFAQRFAGGAAPVKRYGRAYARACWRDLGRTVLAAAVSAAIATALVLVVGDPDRTAAITGLYPTLGLICAVQLLWAAGYTAWPRRTPPDPVPGGATGASIIDR